jgi:alkanesulfonate monooxygenase SsuD/methylene tetrahydromethanopterin reductase-like flavin-dependent oxidoreductase (luciferase family)
VRIGIVLLPEQDWEIDQRRWQRAESYGFDHAWTLDHLAWRTLADHPWHATIPTLTAAALVTSRIRVGALVATPNFRHPVPLAKDLMTLDVLSRGRLNVAVGAGGPGFDAAVLGGTPLSPADRHERFVDFHGLLERLLSEPVTTCSGGWYSAVGARMIPGTCQRPRPPILVAANGPRGLRLAAAAARRAGDGWVTFGTGDGSARDDQWWAPVATTARRMDETLERQDPAGPALSVRMLEMLSRTTVTYSLEQLRDDLGRAAELGFTDVAIAWPRKHEPFRGNEALLDDIASTLPELRRING